MAQRSPLDDDLVADRRPGPSSRPAGRRASRFWPPYRGRRRRRPLGGASPWSGHPPPRPRNGGEDPVPAGHTQLPTHRQRHVRMSSGHAIKRAAPCETPGVSGPAGPSPASGPPRMRQVEDAIRPALGAVVMASGVVSIDLYSDHRAVLSALTLWFAVGVRGSRLSVRIVVPHDGSDCQSAQQANHQSCSPSTGVSVTIPAGPGERVPSGSYSSDHDVAKGAPWVDMKKAHLTRPSSRTCHRPARWGSRTPPGRP